MMNTKKWISLFLVVVFITVAIFGLVEWYLDPLLQYGKERGPLTFREYSELYANPGIAKNYEYDAVLLGSSMVENTNVGEINQLFGCTTIKVPYSGGSSYNHKTILDVCYNSGHRINKVFWSLDEYALTTEKDSPRYPLPEYLYDENKINDFSYILNLDISYFYTLKDVAGTIQHKNQKLMRDGSWVGDEKIYCKENALSSISYPMEQKENKGEKYYLKNLKDNINYNILPFLKAHPETEFHFYMVPYSILYWYQQKQNGMLDAEIYNIKTAIEEILRYENAHVYFFQNEESIITDLNLYKDYTHFKPEVNSWMSQEMRNGSHLLTLESMDEQIGAFYNYLSKFNYDSFFQRW